MCPSRAKVLLTVDLNYLAIMKVLVIEDEKQLSDSITTCLKQEGFISETACDYETALQRVESFEYDCILLDINLPGGSGLDILQQLKKNKKMDGILIISARNSLEDKITGLQSGADDYLSKPFHLSELMARIAAIIRRKNSAGRNLMEFNELSIDIFAKTVTANNKLIELTRKEYQLLLYFAYNKNRVISKNAIAEHLWGDEVESASNYDFIYTHVKNLRKKLIASGCGDYIQSVYGMGYKFSV
ncbi:MAG TPA: response regulator transcription factor [Puia sp.]|nr:response regulator transcription factor [Puia sp.]